MRRDRVRWVARAIDGNRPCASVLAGAGLGLDFAISTCVAPLPAPVADGGVDELIQVSFSRRKYV
ncbi:hypothetical protein M3615_21260, partial [Bacillus halotolerans]|nr:hypothetical protein [Bacillus halotolerans]